MEDTSLENSNFVILKYDILKNPSDDNTIKYPKNIISVLNKLNCPYSAGAIKLANIIKRIKLIP